ncbi:MAG: glycosyltransferase [Candidatus Paceibacterota bacterium]|jgi:glycosyltransferase involved in cell wall biosynthesis
MNETTRLQVLSISTDRDIFRTGSETEGRMKDLGLIVDELHIIVFTKGLHAFQTTQLAPNVWAYPTNSLSRWFYISGAYGLAKKLFFVSSSPSGSAIAQGINLITTQDPFECGLAGYLISKKLNARLHLQVHTDFLNDYFRRHSLLNRIRVMIAKFLIHRHADIRAVSERIKFSILQKMYFGKKSFPRIAVLPVFTDTQRFKDTPESRFLSQKYPGHNLLVLVVSRLEKEKNVELAVRLIEQAKVKAPESRIGLVIAGTGREEKYLRNLAKKLYIADRVFFEGQVADLAPYYKSTDVLLVTSHYEGYGRMFIEAFAAGCPVITPDVGAARDVLGHWNGMICEENDELCLLHNLVLFAGNPLMRDQLKNSARTSAKRFIPKTKEQYLEEYKQMLVKASSGDELFFVY